MKYWRRLKGYFRYNFPLVLRKTMEDRVCEAIRNERRIVNAEVAEQIKILDSLITKMFLVKVTRPDFTRYRIQVDFSDGMVVHALKHGNSQDEIYYIVKRLAAQIEQELRTINFARIPVGYDSYTAPINRKGGVDGN